jgi:serine/threonine protein phosphatase 1
MSKIYAIGDVHGCRATLEKMLLKLAPVKEDSIYFLGDYIDRGPDSKGVIDTILRLRAEGYNVFTLRGNHEQLFIDSDTGSLERALWEQNGGDTTAQSFGITTYADLPAIYKDFFESTQHVYILEEFVLVHAGLNFRLADPFTDTYSMLWIRGSKADRKKIGGRMVVHGHTPTGLETILQQKWEGSSMNIDGGCVYNGVEGMGCLVAIELMGKEMFYEQCID